MKVWLSSRSIGCLSMMGHVKGAHGAEGVSVTVTTDTAVVVVVVATVTVSESDSVTGMVTIVVVAVDAVLCQGSHKYV